MGYFKFALKNLLLFITVIVALASCGNSNDVKIGFLIPAGEGYRWPVDQRYMELAAKEQNVQVITMIANNDENLQLKQAKDLLEMGVDVLVVVAINTNTAAAIVRDAHSFNVPVIAYDRIIKNADLDYFITFEAEKIGTLMVDHALALKPKGNYILLYGDPGDMNAQLIKDAQEKALEPYINSQQIKILYKTYIVDWSMQNAEQTMKKVLAFVEEPIDAIITSYDGLGVGALRALEEYGYEGGIVITGQDAELGAVKAIVEGKMTLTVYKSIKTLSQATMNLAVKLAKNERVTEINSTINNGRIEVPSLLLTPVAVDKNNIRATLIADEFYTEQEIFGH